MIDSKPRFGILLTIGLTLFSFLIAYYANREENPPENTFREQLELIQKEQFTEAYYAYTSKEFQNATTLNAFKNYVRSYLLNDKDNSISIEKKMVSKESATLQVEVAHASEPKTHFEISLIKEDGLWKISGIHEYSPEEKELLASLDGTLTLIQQGNLIKAYQENTTAPFREMTGMDGFKDFIENYPILKDFTSSTLTDVQDLGNQITLLVHFQNNVQSAMILFTMEKEEDQWKIRGMGVQSEDLLPGSSEAFREETLWKVVENQLAAFKEGKVEESYHAYTSSDFQKETSLENFSAFIKAHPIFNHYQKAAFDSLTFDNNVAILTTLIQQDKEALQKAEFYLVLENGTWKVQQIQLFETHNP